MKTKFRKILDSHIILFLGLAAWYLTLGCPLKWLTGIPCAGCGMSRAALALLSLDFGAAWNFHPLVFIMPLVILGFLFRNRMGRCGKAVFFTSVAVMFAAVYFIRLFGSNDIIAIELSKGALYKLIYKIIRRF